MSVDWNALCRSAKEYPLPARLSLTRACFGTLVGLLLLVAAISAWLCARFYRIPKLRRLNEDGKANVWPLSVVGAAGYLCDFFADAALAVAGDPSVQSAANPTDLNFTLTVIVEQRVFPLIAAFDICYPLELLIITNVKLLVIHRFYSVALRNLPAFPSRRLFRIVAILLNSLSATGVALRCVAAHYRLQAAAIAAAAIAPSTSVDRFYRLVASFLSTVDDSKRFASYQLSLEAAALAAMAMALFAAALAFWMSSRRFSRSLPSFLPSLLSKDSTLPLNLHPTVFQAAATSRSALFCAAFVVFSVVFRALFAVPFAVASAAQRSPIAACPSSCASCQSVWFLVYEWIKDNPQIRVVFLIVSEPAAMLVAVWGMTSAKLMHLMRSPASAAAAASSISSLRQPGHDNHYQLQLQLQQ